MALFLYLDNKEITDKHALDLSDKKGHTPINCGQATKEGSSEWPSNDHSNYELTCPHMVYAPAGPEQKLRVLGTRLTLQP